MVENPTSFVLSVGRTCVRVASWVAAPGGLRRPSRCADVALRRSLTTVSSAYRCGVPQVPTFHVDGEIISPSARDGERLAAVLREAGGRDAESAATKLEQAMALGSSTRVELKIGEDEAVLRALERLRESGDFLRALARLERALRTKIDRES
jgi:hypothetical protein